MIRSVRSLALAGSTILCLGVAGAAGAQSYKDGWPDPTDWDAVVEAARGQTVYWNAWAGEQRINAYIAWAGEQVKERYGVELVHVKLSDTAEAVSRVVAEKAAGTVENGSVDLIWINGENFAAMKRQDLLFGPWAGSQPNFALTDPENTDAVRYDFTIPVEGLESPWGKAQIAFMYDSAIEPNPPKTMAALLDWAKANPGQFSYPLIPNFLGSTFLKQAVIEYASNREALYRPVTESDFEEITAPLWAYLDELHPHMWRSARAFPANSSEMRRLMADGELTITFTFSPSDATAAIADNELPDTVRTYVLEGGTIGNYNFVAIPFNAAHKEGAMVLSNFLLSPEAQARKQDPRYWGGFTVLQMDKLSPADRKLFEEIDLGVATLSPDALGAPLPEPHPSWMERLEQAWLTRYGAT